MCTRHVQYIHGAWCPIDSGSDCQQYPTVRKWPKSSSIGNTNYPVVLINWSYLLNRLWCCLDYNHHIHPTLNTTEDYHNTTTTLLPLQAIVYIQVQRWSSLGLWDLCWRWVPWPVPGLVSFVLSTSQQPRTSWRDKIMQNPSRDKNASLHWIGEGGREGVLWTRIWVTKREGAWEKVQI